MTTQGVEPNSKEFLIKIENKIKSKDESDESIIEDLSSASENELSDLYKQTFDSQGTLLHLTVKYRKYRLLEWLFSQNITDNININAGDKSGFTALHLAVINNNPDCVRLLIKHHANPLCKDARERSAYKFANELRDRDPQLIAAFMYIKIQPTGMLERSNNPELIKKLQNQFNELALTNRSTDSSSSTGTLTDRSESYDAVFESVSLATQTKRNVTSTFRTESSTSISNRTDSASSQRSLSSISLASSSSSCSSPLISEKSLKETLVNLLNLDRSNREHYEQRFIQFSRLLNYTPLSELYSSQPEKIENNDKFDDLLKSINAEHGVTTTSMFQFINELKQYYAKRLTNIRSESFQLLKEKNNILEVFLVQKFCDLKFELAKADLPDLVDEMSEADNHETLFRKAVKWLIENDLKDCFEISIGLTSLIPPHDILILIKNNYIALPILEKCVSILIVKNIAFYMLDCIELSPPFPLSQISMFLNLISNEEHFNHKSIEDFFKYLFDLHDMFSPIYIENIKELNSWFLNPAISRKLISFKKTINAASTCEDIKTQNKLVQIIANEIKALSLETLQSIKLSDFNNCAWKKLKDSTILTHARRFDNLYYLITEQIVSSSNEDFFGYYKIWVRLADTLLTPVEGLGPDLGAVLVILNALESKAVCHRKIAFPKIDSEFSPIITQLKNLCSARRNYYNFSEAIQAYQNPLPYLGMFLSQIVHAHENTKPFNKISTLGKIYYDFLPLQRSLFNHPIISDSDLKESLDLAYPNQDELYYLACQFVPHKIYLNEYEGDRVIEELKNCMHYTLKPQFILNEKEIKPQDTFFALCRYLFNEIYFNRRAEDDLLTLAEYQKHCGINYSPLISELSRWIFEQIRAQYFTIDKGMPLLYKYIDALNPSIPIDWGTSVARYSAANAASEEMVYCNPLYIYRGSMQKLEEKKPDVQKSSSSSSSSSSSDSIRNSRKRASTLKRNLSSKGSILFPKG
jgi:hypothetical protein